MRIARDLGVWTALLAVVGACGGGSGGATGGPGDGSLTVSGRVLSIVDTPVANVPVVVDGQEPVVTDPSGYFQATGVRVPYDAIVIDGPGGGAAVWRGLTRADPTFVFTVAGGGFPPSTASASVAGQVTGGVGLPIPAPPPEVKTDVNLWVSSTDLFGSSTVPPNTVTGLYSEGSLSWVGFAPFELTITALQYTLDGAGLPSAFNGFGQLTTPIVNGDVLVGQNIAMGPVTATTISGSTTWPPSVVALLRVVFLTLPGGGFLALPSDTGGAPGFTLLAPDVAGLKRRLLTYGITLAGETVYQITDTLPAPAAGLTVALPNVAGPVLPVDGVTGVDLTTDFTTTPAADDVVYFANFSPSGGGPGPEIQLVTTETSFTIPDLSAYGMQIPAGAQYDWSVTSQGPAATVDDVAVAGEFVPGAFLVLRPGLNVGTGSATRTFFFAP